MLNNQVDTKEYLLAENYKVEKKKFATKYGHFSQDGNEYIINTS